jgi:methionyl-tRNA formyltransferase
MTAASAIFLGSKGFGLTLFKVLVEAAPDVRWRVLHPDDESDVRSARSAFEAYCTARSIPFSLTARSRDAYAAIAEDSPDIVFVCGWYFLVPPDLLRAGPRFLAIHNSLLPKYRGGSPLVWAMIRGDRTVGSTLFGFTPGMDEGPVYRQVSAELGEQDDIGTALARIEQLWTEALAADWPAIVSGALPGSAQDDDEASYAALRRPEDGLIDWNWPASAIHDFVRAQTRPYPGAFTMVGSEPVRIWKSRVVAKPYFGTPGQVLERRGGEILIACGGDSALAVIEASNASGCADPSLLFKSLSVRLAARS